MADLHWIAHITEYAPAITAIGGLFSVGLAYYKTFKKKRNMKTTPTTGDTSTGLPNDTLMTQVQNQQMQLQTLTTIYSGMENQLQSISATLSNHTEILQQIVQKLNMEDGGKID